VDKERESEKDEEYVSNFPVGTAAGYGT